VGGKHRTKDRRDGKKKIEEPPKKYERGDGLPSQLSEGDQREKEIGRRPIDEDFFQCSSGGGVVELSFPGGIRKKGPGTILSLKTSREGAQNDA